MSKVATGTYDVGFGFISRIRFSAQLISTDADQARRFIANGEYGTDLNSTGIVVSRSLARDIPSRCAAFCPPSIAGSPPCWPNRTPRSPPSRGAHR